VYEISVHPGSERDRSSVSGACAVLAAVLFQNGQGVLTDFLKRCGGISGHVHVESTSPVTPLYSRA
jgi:hypothetical protein